MAKITLPECQHCRLPLSCCRDTYCAETIEWAKERWGVKLQPTGHPKLPLMGPNGCIAAPHLRPICTVYTCDFASCGSKRPVPTLEVNGRKHVSKEDMEKAILWNKKYGALRERLSDMEGELDAFLKIKRIRKPTKNMRKERKYRVRAQIVSGISNENVWENEVPVTASSKKAAAAQAEQHIMDHVVEHDPRIDPQIRILEVMEDASNSE